MRRRLLVRHFLNQFVENDFSPDIDRHQLLAVAAAALITIPLFSTVFMSVKYLMQPFQAPGWTEMTAMADQVVFCATSLLVSAAIATLEWDAVALSQRDSMILGVLPMPRGEIVRAKVTALITFAVAFVAALNALPTLLHPPLTVANFQTNPLWLVPLIAAHGLSTTMAGIFGFASVVLLRELLFLCLGEHLFSRVAGTIRAALLFSFLVLLVLTPIRLSGRANWMFEPGKPLLLAPVSWFAATHAATAGRIFDRLRTPSLPDQLAVEEERFRTQYQRNLPALTATALRGSAIFVALLTATGFVYLRNARRFQMLPEGRASAAILGVSHLGEGVAAVLTRRPATRAGLLFLIRTVAGNPSHRVYLTAFIAIGMGLLITLAPNALFAHAAIDRSIRTSELVAQTLMLTAIAAGFRAAVRTSADTRAAWIFGIAETGTRGEFRQGVRLGVIAAMVATSLALFPLHAAAWGSSIAAVHALNGAALGWLLVEVACASVERPLVWTIPPSDGVNTVGVVLLAATVLVVLVLGAIERATLTTTIGTIGFAGVIMAAAACVRRVNEANHRATLQAYTVGIN